MSEPSPAPPSASWTSPPATDAGETDRATPALMHAGPLDTQSKDVEEEGCARQGGVGPGASLERSRSAHVAGNSSEETSSPQSCRRHFPRGPRSSRRGRTGDPSGSLAALTSGSVHNQSSGRGRRRLQARGPLSTLPGPSRRIVHRTHCTLRPHPASRALGSPRPPSGSAPAPAAPPWQQSRGTRHGDVFFQTRGGGRPCQEHTPHGAGSFPTFRKTS